MLRSLLLVAVIAIAASGCAARSPVERREPDTFIEFDALMQSWRGQTVDGLLRTWGPANYVYSDGKGGQVIVYVPIPSSGPSRSSAAAERVRAAARLLVYESGMRSAWPIFRIFFADDTGRIRDTDWRGRWECCAN